MAAPGGFTHVYTDEQLREFRAVPAADKLRWLEDMRSLLERFLTPERREAMERLRRGTL